MWVNISSQEFEAALHQWRKDGGVLPRFGECSVHRVDILATVGHVRVVTRKMSEEEMLPLLEYMKQSMPMEPYYDDHGYGVIPKPHEVRLFWPLPQGEVYMTWDGFNYTRGDEPNHPQGDGLDCITIELWDCARLRQSRDEEYWRSEVD